MVPPVMEFRTYALTVRPRDGITDEQISTTCRWIKKNSEYYHVVTEKTGSSRHLHAGFILKNPRPRSNILQRILQLFPDLSPEERTVLRGGLKIMYNWDFINSYLDKGDDTVLIERCLPESGHLESFFPPMPDPTVPRSERKCSLVLHELRDLWYEHTLPGADINTMSTRDFLFKIIYDLKIWPFYKHDRDLVQMSRHLVRFLNGQSTSTIELAPFEKEE